MIKIVYVGNPERMPQWLKLAEQEGFVTVEHRPLSKALTGMHVDHCWVDDITHTNPAHDDYDACDALDYLERPGMGKP